MFVIIFTVFMIICLIINYRVYKNLLNYLNIFLIMYYIIIVLSNTKIFGFSVPSDTTYYYLLIALIAIEFFSILFVIIKMPIKEQKEEETINAKRLTLISMIITVLMIPTTIEGINIFMNSGFTGLRGAALSTDTYSSYDRIFLSYIISPMNKVVFIYALLDYIKSHKIKAPLIFSIVNVIQMIFTLGGRSVILDFIILSVVIIYEKYSRNIVLIVKKNKKIIIISMLLVIMIIAVTSERSLNRNEGFLFNLYSYYVGSIHLFDVHVENTYLSLLDGNHLLYGKGMLSPVWEITKIGLKLVGFDVDIETGIDIINQQTQQYLPVRDGVRMNNNVTFLYVCLRDFGTFGLIIDSAYIALWFAIIYKLYKKRKSIKTDALYFYMVSNLPYFIFEFVLNKTSTILTFIYIVIVYHIICEKDGQKFNKITETKIE